MRITNLNIYPDKTAFKKTLSESSDAQAVEITIPGAVSLGLKCVDGVVLGNERRFIWGYTALVKNVKKIFKLTDRIALSVAGLISDMQMLAKIMRAQANLYELDHGAPITVKALAKLLSNYLYQRKLMPLYTQVIIAGVDDDGPGLYTLDPIGSFIPDDYAAAGSSTTLAISILESEYKKDITVKEAKALVEKAIINSIKRDATTGEIMDVMTITKDGISEYSKDISEVV
ncbi:MAG: proteasome subunit beta [Promethearchaeota archaeon]